MRDPYYVRISADNMGLEGIHHFYYTVKTDKVKHQIFCNKISRYTNVLNSDHSVIAKLPTLLLQGGSELAL